MAEQREWKNGKPGKLAGQKLKSLLVIQYILKHADEDHPVTMENIQQHLAHYGIEAERRSIPKFHLPAKLAGPKDPDIIECVEATEVE